jgi:hypothetical protein
MRRFFAFALIVAWFPVSASEALALGRDLPKDYLEEHGQLVKGQIPVHGFMVNWEDVFFYSGDTADFNRFVEAYGKIENVELRVVIHAGAKKARSPWDKEDRDIPVDWSYYIWNTGSTAKGGKPAPSRVDVWLGSRIKLGDVRIPANVEVTSGGEIEKFVGERKKK